LSLPSVQSVGARLAANLRNIKVTATCNVCSEQWEAVVLEAPKLGLSFAETLGVIPVKAEDSLQFARAFYQEVFDQGHPQHKMQIAAEFTSLAACAPRQVPFVI